MIVRGGAGAPFAARLAEAGGAVVLVEPDPHDAVRLRDGFARAGLGVEVAATAPSGRSVGFDGTGEVDARVPWRGGPSLHLAGAVLETTADVPEATALARRLGVAHVVTRAGPVSWRLTRALRGEVDRLLLDGAMVAEVDEALEAAGMAEGPLVAEDRAGVALPAGADWPVTARLVVEGKLGRALGAGWYRYPGGGGAVEDPIVDDLILEEARFAGVARREVEADEIVARARAALHAEVAEVVAEGIASEADARRVQALALGLPPG
ncbi:hypothetical protein JQC91_02320 [Jannaschia sp. Os4]|uniref:hypothetical protein n=1 Tax=Jannaschia sp. Os4 TaxID=2807617 RepID=UPI00193958AB|nr:hypothetical protein [Jannaschia sp. Os4]MBM2575128.1 hypothetical protein [Jannaschia sp. Os4]